MGGEIEPDSRYRVVCYRIGRSIPALETTWGTFANAQDEAVRRTTPQRSMRSKNNRRVPDADGTMIFCADPDYPDAEPYRQDAPPEWSGAAVAAGESFPWGADLPDREISKLLRAGAAR